MRSRKISRPIIGWALYDFANSAYTTSILAVIFSVYFVKVLIPSEGVRFLNWTINGATLWSFLNSATMAVTITLSPTLGAWADKTEGKRHALFMWALVGSLCTMGLWAAKPGWIRTGVLLFFFSSIAYEMSLVFYNAFLKDISTDENAGFVSGFGFALGYIGGGLCLGLNMLMLARPDLFHLGGGDITLPHRAGFFVVGIWWLLFSIPIFLWVRDKPLLSFAPPPSRDTFIFHTFRRLKQSFQDLYRMKNAFKFLVAYVIYNDGIQTILLMAAIFGAQALGMSTVQLGLCYLMIQFVAFVGAMICGPLADSWGHKKVVLATLAIYIVVTWRAAFMTSPLEFWVMGFVIGLILGGSQAASRSFFSLLIPETQAGEFFALFSIVGKASSLLGPFVFGVVNQFWGLRVAVGSLLIFFVIGGFLLFFVQEKRSRDIGW